MSEIPIAHFDKDHYWLDSEENYHSIYPMGDGVWHKRREKIGDSLRTAIDAARKEQK